MEAVRHFSCGLLSANESRFSQSVMMQPQEPINSQTLLCQAFEGHDEREEPVRTMRFPTRDRRSIHGARLDNRSQRRAPIVD